MSPGVKTLQIYQRCPTRRLGFGSASLQGVRLTEALFPIQISVCRVVFIPNLLVVLCLLRPRYPIAQCAPARRQPQRTSTLQLSSPGSIQWWIGSQTAPRGGGGRCGPIHPLYIIQNENNNSVEKRSLRSMTRAAVGPRTWSARQLKSNISKHPQYNNIGCGQRNNSGSLSLDKGKIIMNKGLYLCWKSRE
jgi:hypothetical protein